MEKLKRIHIPNNTILTRSSSSLCSSHFPNLSSSLFSLWISVKCSKCLDHRIDQYKCQNWFTTRHFNYKEAFAFTLLSWATNIVSHSMRSAKLGICNQWITTSTKSSSFFFMIFDYLNFNDQFSYFSPEIIIIHIEICKELRFKVGCKLSV